MIKKSAILALMLILAMAVCAYAQEEEEQQEPAQEQEEDEGKWRNFEVVAFGGLSLPMGELSDWNDTLGAGMGVHLGAAAGYYFTDKICAGIYLDYTRFEIEDYEMNYRLYNVGFYGKYCFVGESNFEPYAKLTLGSVWPKFATWIGPDRNIMRELSYDPVGNGGLYAGVLYYTSDFGSIFLELGYQMALTNDDIGEYASVDYVLKDNINYVNIRAGLTVFFGPE